jgi:hypothetical protein
MRFSTVLLTFVSFTTVFGHVIARGKGDGGDECKEDCEYKSSMTSSYYEYPMYVLRRWTVFRYINITQDIHL